MRCGICGKEESIPFRCSYCGEYFCADHRLPESHACSGLWVAKVPSRKEAFQKPSSRKVWEFRPQGRMASRMMVFSASEVKHLVVGMVLVVAVGLSIFSFSQSPLAMLASALLFAASFLLHELAHKIEAQRHGLWAEFRINLQSALITLLSIIAPFKLIAPGAVVVAGPATPRVVVRLALAGPLVNMVLGWSLYAFALIYPGIWRPVLSSGAYVNAILAVFNLIPLSILDGKKIFNLNRGSWVKAFIPSVILLVLVIWSFRDF